MRAVSHLEIKNDSKVIQIESIESTDSIEFVEYYFLAILKKKITMNSILQILQILNPPLYYTVTSLAQREKAQSKKHYFLRAVLFLTLFVQKLIYVIGHFIFKVVET